MKQPGQGGNPALKNAIFLIVGIVFVFLACGDLFSSHEDNFLSSGGVDTSTYIYLPVGILLTVLGIVGMMKNNRNNTRRRY